MHPRSADSRLELGSTSAIIEAASGGLISKGILGRSKDKSAAVGPALEVESYSGMTMYEAMLAMRSPSEMQIICIDVTNKCDLACSNCTRLLANQDGLWDMTLDNFRLAARSLADYPGIIAMIGGNPCMHRNFEDLCQIFVEEIPEKVHRGLWTNNLFKFEKIAIETFGIFNMNPHNVERGIKSLENLKNLGWYYTGNSEHSSLLVAVKDLLPENQMWETISQCEINQKWSASIIQNQGKLRAYFCEVAASFDLARGTDHGIEVTPGWWKKPLDDFESQIAHFCPGCGASVGVAPAMDYEEVDTYSMSNEDLALKSASSKKRKIIEIKTLSEAKRTDHSVVQYSPNLTVPW
jgi:organic radical activating enzyme